MKNYPIEILKDLATGEKQTVTTPDWVKDAIFYQIFPDRFAKGPLNYSSLKLQAWDAAPSVFAYKGGNLLGIVEKLDYLTDLGINAIYLNPIFASTANHRYHTFDYYQVDPLLGGNQALRTLLDAAHGRGIRVVLDGVFNHVGRGFFQFSHILECGADSPYLDWFHIKDHPLYAYDYQRKPNYQAWYELRELPKLNTNNPDVRRLIYDVARYWVDFGIDGWRLDVADQIDDDGFWREFRRLVKAANPEAYIVGEVWVDETNRTAKRWLAGDQFDAIMNYGLTSACIAFFIGSSIDHSLLKGQSHAPQKLLYAESFAALINTMLCQYPAEIVFAQYNLLDSHDTARYLSLARENKPLVKLAATFLLTYPGAPAIYYGDEIGLLGGLDPDCRRAMPWDRSRWDTDLLEYYQKLILIRKKYRSLRRGGYRVLHADSASNVYAFMRHLKEENIIVILNNSDKIYEVDIPIENYLPHGARLECLLSDRSFQVKDKRIRGPFMIPYSGVVLGAASKAG